MDIEYDLMYNSSANLSNLPYSFSREVIHVPHGHFSLEILCKLDINVACIHFHYENRCVFYNIIVVLDNQ